MHMLSLFEFRNACDCFIVDLLIKNNFLQPHDITMQIFRQFDKIGIFDC